MLVGQGPQRGFCVPARSAAKIREIAGNARSALGVKEHRFDAEWLLETLSAFSITVDVIENSDPDLPSGVDACWVPDRATIIFRASVYEQACQQVPRALFTVAHEIGHICLGHTRTFNREPSREIKVYEDSEWQANTFAAEFLMPLCTIQELGLATPQAIMTCFGVSFPAANTRYENLLRQRLLLGAPSAGDSA